MLNNVPTNSNDRFALIITLYYNQCFPYLKRLISLMIFVRYSIPFLKHATNSSHLTGNVWNITIFPCKLYQPMILQKWQNFYSNNIQPVSGNGVARLLNSKNIAASH